MTCFSHFLKLFLKISYSYWLNRAVAPTHNHHYVVQFFLLIYFALYIVSWAALTGEFPCYGINKVWSYLVPYLQPLIQLYQTCSPENCSIWPSHVCSWILDFLTNHLPQSVRESPHFSSTLSTPHKAGSLQLHIWLCFFKQCYIKNTITIKASSSWEKKKVAEHLGKSRTERPRQKSNVGFVRSQALGQRCMRKCHAIMNSKAPWASGYL